MSASDRVFMCALATFFALLSGAVFFLNGFAYCERTMREEAVKRGCAEYNPQTGAWQWKEEKAHAVQ